LPLRCGNDKGTISPRAYSRNNADGVVMCSARPPNGSDPKLHGQGPRAEA